MSESKFSYPTEKIDLPSRGILYPKSSPLSSGFVEMKYLTAKGEDILSNQNYIAQGTVLDKLFTELIATPGVELNDMFSGDMDAIFYSARVLSYGSKYEFYQPHPKTKEEVLAVVNLSEIENKPLDPLFESATSNEFEFLLPTAQIPITVKLLTRSASDALTADVKKWEKLFPGQSVSRSFFLKHSIVSVNGNRDSKYIKDFVETVMLARDSKEVRSFLGKITPGLNTKVTITYPDGSTSLEEVPFSVNMFWPEV